MSRWAAPDSAVEQVARLAGPDATVTVARARPGGTYAHTAHRLSC
jgi:hypothetical protein